MTSPLITDPHSFAELCDHIRQSGVVAFDTEFVSEFTHRPNLCLLQFATRERCVVVEESRYDARTVVSHAPQPRCFLSFDDERREQGISVALW